MSDKKVFNQCLFLSALVRISDLTETPYSAQVEFIAGNYPDSRRISFDAEALNNAIFPLVKARDPYQVIRLYRLLDNMNVLPDSSDSEDDFVYQKKLKKKRDSSRKIESEKPSSRRFYPEVVGEEDEEDERISPRHRKRECPVESEDEDDERISLRNRRKYPVESDDEGPKKKNRSVDSK